MKKILLPVLLLIMAFAAFAQKKLVITDATTGEDVKRIDFTKIFSYKIKGETYWRNGFVTGFEKDTVRLNNGVFATKKFDIIKQNKKTTPFLNTAADGCFWTGLSAIGLTPLFYVLERADNEDAKENGEAPRNNYGLTKGSLIVGVGMGVIGGTLKLLTKKKSIQLGDRFTLVIK